jgi:hypothetical protein
MQHVDPMMYGGKATRDTTNLVSQTNCKAFLENQVNRWNSKSKPSRGHLGRTGKGKAQHASTTDAQEIDWLLEKRKYLEIIQGDRKADRSTRQPSKKRKVAQLLNGGNCSTEAHEESNPRSIKVR